MQVKSPHHAQVVKCMEKAEKLTSFIVAQIDRIRSPEGDVPPHRILVVALSAESPVVSALKSSAEQRDLSRASIRIVLADIEPSSGLQAVSGLPACTLKWANNPRLLDAHEQLVVGESACWTGDCMRRDPRKRDAFETYLGDCREGARWAATSFERLWRLSQCVDIAGGVAVADDLANSDALPALNSHAGKAEFIVRTRN